MWEKLFDLMTKVFTLSVRVDRLEKDVEALRQDNKQLLEELSRQKAQIDVLVYAVQNENDKTRMWVEKELLKFERRLPAGGDEKSDD
jgi:outer membrane murein-binding lipoprotein Lpp